MESGNLGSLSGAKRASVLRVRNCAGRATWLALLALAVWLSAQGPARADMRSDPEWRIQTVDATGISVGHVGLATDSNDRAHIAYDDNTNKNLKYATNASGPWTLETIDSVGDTWAYVAIALDHNDAVHIAYYDATNADLKYTTNKSGFWVKTTIDSSGTTGWDISIALDSQNHAHISYKSQSTGYLMYATNKSGSWAVSQVDTSGWNGAFSSIVIDGADKVHIAYFDQSWDRLEYATNASGSWVVTPIDPVGDGWEGCCSLTSDPQGKMHIAYKDLVNQDLRYATNASGAWTKQTLDSVGDLGERVAIAVDNDGAVHICYQDRTNNKLKYATDESGGWEVSSVVPSGTAWNRFLAVDSNHVVHIAYRNTANGRLMYASKVMFMQTTAPAGWFVPGWVWFSIPLDPRWSAEASDVLGFDGTNRLYAWDDAAKTIILYPDDFTELFVGPSYLARLVVGEAYVPSYEGARPPQPLLWTLPAAGWCWVGVPGSDDIRGLDLVIEKGGTVRTPADDRGAADPWLNWNWIFWDPGVQTAGIMDPFGAGDDDTLHPWWGYRVWSNTEDVTIIFP